MNRFLYVGALAVLLVACGSDGGNSLECGEGTFEFDGQCVSVDPNDATAPVTSASPAPGRFRDLGMVVLSTDEPATIFYTTDGSTPSTSSPSEPSPVTIANPNGTIRYFAVDLASNEEAPQEGTWDVDVAGPGPVANLTSTVTPNAADGDITLNWENPSDSDFAGVVVARSIAQPVAADPIDGVAVAVGDMIADGLEVIFVGDATSAMQAAQASALYRYRVWTFDDLNNFSVARSTTAVQPVMGAQTGTLSVDLTTGTVTVTNAPAGFTLAATATFTAGTQQLEVNLDVTNDLGRHVFSPKVVTTSLNEGTQQNVDSIRGLPFVRLGRAIDVGQTRSNSLSFGGVTGGTDPILIDVSIEDGAQLISSREVVDTTAPGIRFNVPSNGHAAAISADGRFLFGLAKDRPNIELGDLVTGQQIGNVAFAGGSASEGSYGGIAVQDDSIFVVFNEGAHYKGGNGDGATATFAEANTNIFLRELDPVSFAVRRELPLLSAATGKAAHQIHISPDGQTLAVPVTTINGQGNEIWFIKLSDFSIVDADAATAGDQPVVLGTDGMIDHSTWSEDGARYYAAYNNHNDGEENGPGTPLPIDVIAMSDFGVSQLTPAGAFAASAGILEKGGKVYYLSCHDGGTNELSVFDATGTETASSPFGGGARGGLVFDNTGTMYFLADGRGTQDVAAFLVADDTEVDLDGDATNGVTRFSMSGTRAYLLMTPF